VLVAIVLMVGHDAAGAGHALIIGPTQIVAGVIGGFAMGVVAALLGIAGGELLIPTLLLRFSADIKLAGNLSLAVSLPTMLIGFARYSRDRSFAVLGRNRLFTLVMAAGSIVGSFIGSRLLGFVPRAVLLPLLAAILLISAVKVWQGLVSRVTPVHTTIRNYTRHHFVPCFSRRAFKKARSDNMNRASIGDISFAGSTT